MLNQIAANGIAHHADWYVAMSATDDGGAEWTPDSWTRAEARQLPTYPDAAALDAATEQLAILSRRWSSPARRAT